MFQDLKVSEMLFQVTASSILLILSESDYQGLAS